MEVTTIEAELGDGADVRPVRGWVESIRRWISSKETELLRQGLLNGRYRLRAAPVEDFAKAEREIIKSIRAYLQKTATEERSPRTTVWAARDPMSTWSIEKLRGDGNKLVPGLGFRPAEYEGEAEIALGPLLAHCLSRKAAPAMGARPSVLLILDQLKSATSDGWEIALDAYGDHPFHTIARICHGTHCKIVFTRDSAWS